MTKREHVPAGYDPSLDRRQPPPMPCLPLTIALAVLLLVIGLVVFGISRLSANQSQPIPTAYVLPTEPPIDFAAFVVVEFTDTSTVTPSATRTVTPDSWGRTGTALARATASETPTPTNTADYCDWLTPSPTFTPTLPFTPDAWSATGTAIYLATNPPATPTPELPRELCTDLPTATLTLEATPSFTPFPFPGTGTQQLPEFLMATASAAAPVTRPAFVTMTAAPTQTARVEVREVEVIITSPPEVIRQPVEVPVEIPVEVPVEVPVTVYVTAPPQVITATMTPSFTHSLTPTNTTTATPTNTATATFTATTLPPTATFTPTWTFTYTPTFTSTPTETPTDVPTTEPTIEVSE